MRTVTVPLDDRSYPILIGENILENLGANCRRLKLGKRCAIITDSNVAPHYAQRTADTLKAAGFDGVVIQINAGEQSKDLKNVGAVLTELASHRLERSSFVVALGGGVVGDLAGFVAATYLRGIDFVQVPTSLLAQVDSSVGGKTGVNLKAGKNLVGAFYQPRLVVCDIETFATLPDREFRSGLAEIIKYGIIYDPKLFTYLERRMDQILARDSRALAKIIARSCEIKAEVVGEDEREGGLRTILNFGHTIGHAIEAISGYGKYLHGEAISIGQIAAAKLSAQVARLSDLEVERIEKVFASTGLPTSINLNAKQLERLHIAMQLDKKVKGGETKFVLADRIGAVRWGINVPPGLIDNVLDHK
jgi:3-dehydroquinate synthase